MLRFRLVCWSLGDIDEAILRAAVVPCDACSRAERPYIVDTGNAEHYLWGGANDGWHLLKRDDLSIIRERMVPGAKEERHLHRKARQFFHVLAGVFTVEIAGRDFTLSPGQGIEVPPGTAHQAKNLTDGPVEFLVISMPPSHGDRVAAAN
jgi:mannose-6-phosphate isomerase-like protein (cupin superfamily)